MPEKFLKKLNTHILPQWKTCFFSALLVGLLAHLYKITNWLPNWDSLVFRYDSQNMVMLGRWFLPVVCSLSSFYDLPFLNGIMAIIFHGLGAVCICKMMGVKRRITAFMIGAVIVSFPTVTSVMMYNYVADGYSIAFFLSTLAALYMTKEKPNFIIAAMLIALSAGIYQAYITVTIMLVLLKLIDEVIYKNAVFPDVLRKAVYMLLAGALGVAVYGLVLKIILSMLSVELLNYQGISETASLSGIDIPGSLYVVKETFKKCFFDLSGGVNTYVILNSFVSAFTFVHYIKHAVESKLYKSAINILTIIVLCVLLVIGAGALAFVNAGIDYHGIMLMGYSVFYMFFLLLYERGAEKNAKLTAVKCWVVFVGAVMVILNQVVIANVSYHKAQIAYEKSYGVLMRIADRIDETPGSGKCDKILVVGALNNSEAYSAYINPEITGITDGYIIRADDETVGQSVLTSSLNDYCGKNYKFVSGKEKQKIIQRDDVKDMDVWPQEGCIRIIDDIIVIKLGA